jgi:anthranilate synthase/aminodeoxychorismate synthase-like glutamine amidotransferase
MIDNFDSFTYNLVQYMGELGADLQVYRNNRISVEEIGRKRPEKIVVSPGPCTPNEAGVSLDVIRAFSGKIPILGVCLGHQSIGQAFGGKVIRAPRLRHGKTSEIHHDGGALFHGMSNPFTATRYHSLIVQRETLPDCLEVSAWTGDGDNLIMGLRHREHPTEGVQFHPESILTPEGKRLIENFLKM